MRDTAPLGSAVWLAVVLAIAFALGICADWYLNERPRPGVCTGIRDDAGAPMNCTPYADAPGCRCLAVAIEVP